jgi:hypothetical protein
MANFLNKLRKNTLPYLFSLFTIANLVHQTLFSMAGEIDYLDDYEEVLDNSRHGNLIVPNHVQIRWLLILIANLKIMRNITD